MPSYYYHLQQKAAVRLITRPRVCRDSGQAESKTAGSENRSGAYLKYVSTGLRRP